MVFLFKFYFIAFESLYKMLYDFVALQRWPEHAQQKIAEEFTPTGSGARAAALLTQQ